MTPIRYRREAHHRYFTRQAHSRLICYFGANGFEWSPAVASKLGDCSRWPVSARVGDVRNNDPSLIEAIADVG